MKLLSFGSIIVDLFVVDGAEPGSLLASLPYLVLACVIGVVLASVYFTTWHIIEAKLARRLYDAGATSAADAKTLSEVGYTAGSKGEGILRFLLRSHACMIYKTMSCDELDAQTLALMKQNGEIPSFEEDAVVLPDEEKTGDAPSDIVAANKTPVSDTLGEQGEESDLPAAPDSAAPKTATPPRKKKRLRPNTRMKIGPDTRFYIRPTSLEYVEGHALKFTKDEIWGMAFTIVGSIIIGVALLALLDPMAGFFLK